MQRLKREEEERRRREEEEHVRKINDPKDWPELSPAKRVAASADSGLLATANGDRPLAGEASAHFPENNPGMKSNSRKWPSLEVNNGDGEKQMVNAEKSKSNQTESAAAAGTKEERGAVPKRPQRLTSRCRRPSPPPPPPQEQQQPENHRDEQARAWPFEIDHERYQYIAKAILELEGNGAKNREAYDNPCHVETTQVMESPAASSAFYTPAATPDRQSATPPAFSRNTQLDTEVHHIAGLLTQHSLKDLLVNAETQGSLLGEYSILPQLSQYTPPESPEVQDDRSSYNRRYGHLFYRDNLPYKFFNAVQPDRTRDKCYGGLWTHFGDGNGALNGFTENLLEQTMRIKVREEDERQDGSSHWLDQVQRRRGMAHACHAWGNYEPYSPIGNRSNSPDFYFNDGDDYHQLLDF